MVNTSISAGRKRGYVICVALLLVWVLALLAFALTVIPDAYWYSYFSVDYSVGFIRRGLAGELLSLFPSDHYFGALAVLRWVPTVFFIMGLVAVGWAIWVRSGRSERHLLMALLIPVLPFGVAFGLFSARTDLLGAAALAGFAVTLAQVRTNRSVVVASAVFGLVTAVLTLMHEAIPFLYGLGALAALTVLARRLYTGKFVVAAAFAIGPGLATALAVAALGERGMSAKLCQLVPHGPTNHPLAGDPTLVQLLRGFRYDVDYHDWLCRAILPLFDQGFSDGVRFVASIGTAALAASTAYGLVVLAVTMLAISHVSGVPIARFRTVLRKQPVAMVIGLALMVPVFMTGVDWIRWWVVIAFDLGIVFLLWAAGESETNEPPSRRTLRVFTAGVVLLAAIPIGVIPAFGAPVPM